MSRPLKPRCPRCSYRRTLVEFDGNQKVCNPCRNRLRLQAWTAVRCVSPAHVPSLSVASRWAL